MAFSPAARLLALLPTVEYEDEVNAAYECLPAVVQQEITKDDLQQILDSTDEKEEALKQLKKGGGAAYYAKVSVKNEALSKLQTLSKLTVSPRETDLLIARFLFKEQYKTPRSLDPCGYAANGFEQSYETLTTNALFSTRTINDLDDDSVHFMMFRHGETKIQCQRFSFGNNPLISGAARQGDPCFVDEEFCQLLGIAPDNLANHPLRLEMIQNVLRTIVLMELEVQALFLHWLGGLVQELEGAESDMRVSDVVGMNAVSVSVEVCNEYMRLAGKTENPGGTGISRQLSIKSDAVVCHKSFVGDSNQAFLHCAYHIEMKQATKLKNSAMDCKSQLLAESLAKSQALLRKNKELPQVIYSVLCDGLCLHVLIHFPRQSKAYLSHREIEPGRMTCIVAWLHKLSARDDLTEEEFLAMGFCIGDSIEAEVQNIVNKKRARACPQGSKKSKAHPSAKKRPNGTKRTSPLIDVAADDERSKQDELQRGLATFSKVQNYYRYNDPLPLTESVLENVHDSQPLSREDKLQLGLLSGSPRHANLFNSDLPVSLTSEEDDGHMVEEPVTNHRRWLKSVAVDGGRLANPARPQGLAASMLSPSFGGVLPPAWGEAAITERSSSIQPTSRLQCTIATLPPSLFSRGRQDVPTDVFANRLASSQSAQLVQRRQEQQAAAALLLGRPMNTIDLLLAQQNQFAPLGLASGLLQGMIPQQAPSAQQGDSLGPSERPAAGESSSSEREGAPQETP